MVRKAKNRLLPTLIAAAMVIGAAYTFIPSLSGEEDIQQTLRLTVTFTSDRTKSTAIKVTYSQEGRKPVVELALTSPWERTVVVRRGDVVVLGALQSDTQPLSCQIREYVHDLASDSNHEPNGKIRTWVRCVTGGD
jgi:hypothetical protein